MKEEDRSNIRGPFVSNGIAGEAPGTSSAKGEATA